MIIEDVHTELKRKVTDDLKKEIIAFSNSTGGVVYIGFEDDGTLVGVEDVDASTSKITNMLRDAIRPDITMFVDVIIEEIQGQKIIKLDVSQGVNKPYYLSSKGLKPTGVYIRQGLSAAPASEEHIRRMIIETDGDSFESIRSMNQDLTFDRLQKEFRKIQLPLEESQMRTLGFLTLNDRMYTNLGLLLSDQAVHTIKVAVFEGKTKQHFKDRREFSGSLLDQVEEAYQYIDLFNKTKSDIEGLYRKDNNEYPPIAIRETLINAIVHREYALSGSTLISIFDDRIEFVTLGGLAAGVSLEDIFMGISQSRNEKLAAVFYRLELVEAYGTGVSKILDSYKDTGAEPRFEVSVNAFKVTLYNINSSRVPQYLTDKEEKVLRMLERNYLISRKDVEKVLGVSQTMSGRVLKQLTDKNLIVRSGSGPSTRYKKGK